MERAGNETLGFHKIWFLNLKKRYDRTDAVALQSYMSGIDVEDFPGVEKEMISPAGMPPTDRPGSLKVSELGCYRAHANVWSQVIRKRLPPVLILESDAAWDINIRSIMSNMNRYFVEFLRDLNSTILPSAGYGWTPPKPLNNLTSDAKRARTGIEYNPDDPWLSEHWDVFSIGQCFETPNGAPYIIYPDRDVPPGREYNGYTMKYERVLRVSGGFTCTTSYAISQTGAAKLLLRSSINLGLPVDLLIRHLIMENRLVAYSVVPTVIAQWEYAGGIGMEQRGAQSDIRGGDEKSIDENTPMPGWKDVWRRRSVWITKSHHPDVSFRNMGLTVAWDRIFGRDRVPTDDEWKRGSED
ncbi:hypothetical protein GQ53DRAFT_777271 [Thozetella sp. PMI_491]|nr:hypothetical protein GQ53DRAFT_777271 [Thozetella sp. PMI_491]